MEEETRTSRCRVKRMCSCVTKGRMDLGLSPASLPLPGGSREFRSITEIPGARPYLHSSPPKGTDIRDRGKLGWGTRSNLNCGVRWDLGSPRHPLQASGPSLTELLNQAAQAVQGAASIGMEPRSCAAQEALTMSLHTRYFLKFLVNLQGPA